MIPAKCHTEQRFGRQLCVQYLELHLITVAMPKWHVEWFQTGYIDINLELYWQSCVNLHVFFIVCLRRHDDVVAESELLSLPIY